MDRMTDARLAEIARAWGHIPAVYVLVTELTAERERADKLAEDVWNHFGTRRSEECR